MTLEEKIIDISKTSFLSGVKFANKLLVEKACEWLTDHADDYKQFRTDRLMVDEMVDDFRTEMKKQVY